MPRSLLGVRGVFRTRSLGGRSIFRIRSSPASGSCIALLGESWGQGNNKHNWGYYMAYIGVINLLTKSP